MSCYIAMIHYISISLQGASIPPRYFHQDAHLNTILSRHSSPLIQILPSTDFRSRIGVSGDIDNIAVHVFEHNEIARDRLAGIHVCERGLVKGICPAPRVSRCAITIVLDNAVPKNMDNLSRSLESPDRREVDGNDEEPHSLDAHLLQPATSQYHIKVLFLVDIRRMGRRAGADGDGYVAQCFQASVAGFAHSILRGMSACRKSPTRSRQ